MKTYLLVILFIFSSGAIFSQKDKGPSNEFVKNFTEADDLMSEGNFTAALPVLLELLENDPDNSNLYNRIGICYMNTAFEKGKAIKYFEAALKNTAIDAKPELATERRSNFESYYNLGKAYHVNYKFDDAIKLYNGYIDKIVEIQNNDSLVYKAEKGIEISKNAIELMKKPVQMKVESLGSNVNTQFPEYSPFINADESVMIFTSKREGSTGGKQTEDGQFFEDIYISTKDKDNKWSSAQNIGAKINQAGHDATCGLSVDGTELFIYRDDGNIYSSKQVGNDWSEPQSLGPFVNTQYGEKGAAMSASGNFLFFASDRPGGYGGFDIYISKKLPNGQWGEAFNLGPNVNTELDELGPFFHPDESTLFFASQGHNTMGGFDLFYTSINVEEGIASVPVNLGYPINSTDDDAFISVTPDGLRAYYSSFKIDGKGYTDLYLITLKEPLNKSLTVLSGVVKKSDTKDYSGISITVTDLESNENIGTYTPNASTGKYIFIVNAGKKYSAYYEASGYISEKRDLGVSKDSTYEALNRVMKMDTVFLTRPSISAEVPFDKKSAELNAEGKKSIENAIQFLQANKKAPVRITFKPGTDLKLKDKRFAAITDMLAKYNIDKNRVIKESDSHKGQLCDMIISEKEDLISAVTNEKKDQKADKNETTNKNSQSNLDNLGKLDVGMTIVLNNVLFHVDKAYITEAAYAELHKLLEILNKYPKMCIEISGHTDNTGTVKHNNVLSKKRAKGVTDYLIMKGISKDRLTHQGFGSSRPMVSNDTDDGKRLNRRVEFKITKM